MSLFGGEGGEDSESKKMFTSFSHDIWSDYSDATRPISPKKGSWWREIPLFQGNPDWWNILVWPDHIEGRWSWRDRMTKKQASEWVAWGWICGKLQQPTKSLGTLWRCPPGLLAGLAMSQCRCLGNDWEKWCVMIFPGSPTTIFYSKGLSSSTKKHHFWDAGWSPEIFLLRSLFSLLKEPLVESLKSRSWLSSDILGEFIHQFHCSQKVCGGICFVSLCACFNRCYPHRSHIKSN